MQGWQWPASREELYAGMAAQSLVNRWREEADRIRLPLPWDPVEVPPTPDEIAAARARLEASHVFAS